jgi:DNA sulfur modification protein DndB
MFCTNLMQKKVKKSIKIKGMLGLCGSRKVFLGFAPASLLHGISFADVLDEETGKGYQRPISEPHSLQFRKYIQQAGATTIPLTFNLRPTNSRNWTIAERKDEALLQIDPEGGPVLAQVDCQHRLSFLKDLPVPLAFMTFIGLSIREEMEVFNIINSKAKGLSSSLLDYHVSKLSADLSAAKPEIYIALKLNDSPESPWYRNLDLGGKKTVGMHRYASLRTMQKAIRRFLRESQILKHHSTEDAYAVVANFWIAVRRVLESQWAQPRKFFLTKGIGVYSLMSIAGDIYKEAEARNMECDVEYFVGVISDFANDIDWSSQGPLKGFGGAGGADQALELLRQTRTKKRFRVISNAK